MIVAVMMPRQPWTDERLDHFEKRVDERFDIFEGRVDERFDAINREMKLRFGHVDKQLETVNADLREMRQAIEQMQVTMSRGIIGLAGLIASAAVFLS